MRKPKRFARLKDPVATVDGRHLAVCVEAEDGAELDLEIPAEQIGDIVAYLVQAASYLRPPEFHGQKEVTPIPIQGLGFSTGANPKETLLLVRGHGFELAFPLDNQRIRELGAEFAQVAKALSADGRTQ